MAKIFHKKRVPAIVFNDGDYKYPKGLRVIDEDDLDIKLKSGEWNTGPVDKKMNPVKQARTDSEKRVEIQRLLDELDEDSLDTDPLKIEPGKPKKESAKTESDKKHLSHMNISELIVEAGNISLKVDEDWTKTQLYEAIKKKKG